MSLFSGTTIPITEQVLNFAQARHEVLAGNIANADTPGYRTRDLSPAEFEKKLGEAIAHRDSRNTSLGSVYAGGADLDDLAQVKKSLNSILYHDDSNVGLEQQVAELSKNQFKHNLALTIMRSQFALMRAAISERVA
jgi:flagellar basal-body rod protein FlgB